VAFEEVNCGYVVCVNNAAPDETAEHLRDEVDWKAGSISEDSYAGLEVLTVARVADGKDSCRMLWLG
jgi:hypothetical protein